jgi:hypothetical protein
VKELHSEDCAALEKETEDTRREKDSSMPMGWKNYIMKIAILLSMQSQTKLQCHFS